MKKRTDYKKQSIGILMVAAVVSVLLAGTILGPMQAYASSNNNNPGSSGSTDDGFINSPSLNQGIHDEIRADLKNTNQSINQDNVCFKSNTCRQSEVGQNTLGNDNQVTGFADQSTSNTTTAKAATSGPAGPAGAKGDPGAQGPAGPDKILSTREVHGETKTGGPGFISAFADCADDEAVTGGGYIVSPQNSVAQFIVNGNTRHIDGAGDHNGWRVQVFSSIDDVSLTAFAECAKLVPPP
jgi:hypothetical protein